MRSNLDIRNRLASPRPFNTSYQAVVDILDENKGEIPIMFCSDYNAQGRKIYYSPLLENEPAAPKLGTFSSREIVNTYIGQDYANKLTQEECITLANCYELLWQDGCTELVDLLGYISKQPATGKSISFKKNFSLLVFICIFLTNCYNIVTLNESETNMQKDYTICAINIMSTMVFSIFFFKYILPDLRGGESYIEDRRMFQKKNRFGF